MSSALDVISRVQAGTTGASTSVATAAQAHAAGNGLVALLFHASDLAGAATFTAPTNTAGDTFIQCGSDFTGNTNNPCSIWYTSASAGHASDVVTGHFTGSTTYRNIVIYELYGGITLDQTKTATVNGTSLATASFSLATAAEIILANGLINSGAAVTAGSGYTLVQHFVTGDGVTYFFDEYHNVSSNETASVSWTGATNADMIASSFYAAGGGGATVTYSQLERGIRGLERGLAGGMR